MGGEGGTRFHSACSLGRGSEILNFGILTGHKIRHELKWYRKTVAKIVAQRLHPTPPPPLKKRGFGLSLWYKEGIQFVVLHI